MKPLHMSSRVEEFQFRLSQSYDEKIDQQTANAIYQDLLRWPDALSICCTIYENALSSGGCLDEKSAKLIGGFMRMFCRRVGAANWIKAQTDGNLLPRLLAIISACLTAGDSVSFFNLFGRYADICSVYKEQALPNVQAACDAGFQLLNDHPEKLIGVRVLKKFVHLMPEDVYQSYQDKLKEIFASGGASPEMTLRVLSLWKRGSRVTIENIKNDEQCFVLTVIRDLLTLPQQYHARQEKITDPNVLAVVWRAATVLSQLLSRVSYGTDETNGVIINRIRQVLTETIRQTAPIIHDTFPDGRWREIRGILLSVVFTIMPDEITDETVESIIQMAVSLFTLLPTDDEELENPTQWYDMVYPSYGDVPLTWRYPRNWGTTLLRRLAQEHGRFDQVFQVLFRMAPHEEVLFALYRLEEIIPRDSAVLECASLYLQEVLKLPLESFTPISKLTLGLTIGAFAYVLPEEVISVAASIGAGFISERANEAYLTAACEIVYLLVSDGKWTPPTDLMKAIIHLSKQTLNGVGVRLTYIFMKSGEGEDFIYEYMASAISEIAGLLTCSENDIPRDRFSALCEWLADTFEQYPDIQVPCTQLCQLFTYHESFEIGIIMAGIARGAFKNHTNGVCVCIEPWIVHVQNGGYDVFLDEIGALFCCFITFQGQNGAKYIEPLYQTVMNMLKSVTLFNEDWCSLIKILTALTQAKMLTGTHLQAALEVARNGNRNTGNSDKIAETFAAVELFLSAFIACDQPLDDDSINYWMQFLRAGQFSTNYLRMLSVCALRKMDPKPANAEELHDWLMRGDMPFDKEFDSDNQYLYWNSEDILMPIQLVDLGPDFVVGEN